MNIIAIILILAFIAAIVLLATSFRASESKGTQSPICRIVKEKQPVRGYLYKVEKFDDSFNIWTHIKYFDTEEEAFNAVDKLEEYGTIGEVIYQTRKTQTAKK